MYMKLHIIGRYYKIGHLYICPLKLFSIVAQGYTPIRLAEYSNKSHILLVQGYSEQGELSVTSLNFTGTLGCESKNFNQTTIVESCFTHKCFFLDPAQEVKFTHDSPILVGRNLTVFVEASKSYDSVMCEVHMLTAKVSRQDCKFTCFKILVIIQ